MTQYYSKEEEVNAADKTYELLNLFASQLQQGAISSSVSIRAHEIKRMVGRETFYDYLANAFTEIDKPHKGPYTLAAKDSNIRRQLSKAKHAMRHKEPQQAEILTQAEDLLKQFVKDEKDEDDY